MPKPKLLIYSQQISECPFFEIIYKADFIVETVATTKKLKNRIKTFNPDAIIACFCQAQEKDIAELSSLYSIINLVPLISCSRIVDSDFVFAAAQNGADYFINCSEEKEKIVNTVNKIIQQGGIKKFFDACYPDSFSFSPYINKIVGIIINTFPNRLHEKEIARQIDVSERQIRALCKQVYEINFNKLMRRISIYQALRMMQLTNLDNTGIALQLNYSEESSMVRDFRKELGCTCSEARKLLLNHTPIDLLK